MRDITCNILKTILLALEYIHGKNYSHMEYLT